MAIHRLVKTWTNRPATDYVAVAVATVAAWFVRAQGIHPLEHLDGADRLDWLQTLSGVSAALLGFEIAAVTIFFTVAPGPRLRRALGEVGFGLVALVRSSLVVLALCTAIYALAGPFYVGGRVTGVSFLLLVTTTLALLRTSRLLTLLFLVLRTFAAEAQEGTQSEIPPLVRGWEVPEIGDDDYAMPTLPPPRVRRKSK